MEFVIFQIAVLVFSVVVHEVSHGVVAYSLGDSTAKNEGRLTLNPIPHIDIFGSIILPGMMILLSFASGVAGPVIGWAKPVPINPFNLRDQKYGAVKVSLAGPASNLAIALVFGLLLRFAPAGVLNPLLGFAFSMIAYMNILLAVFNLVPIPPLDGSHLLFAFLPRSMDSLKSFFARYGSMLLLILIFFFFGIISFVADALFALIVGAPLR